MLNRYELYEGQLRACDNGDAQVLVYVDPSDEERNYLIREMALDEHTLASALDPDELSRVEFEPEHIAVIYKRPKSYTANDNFLFRVSSTGFYLFKDKVVIVLCGDAPIFDHSRNLNQLNTLSDLLLKLMQRAIGQFNGHMKAINLIIDELEKKLVASMGNRHLLNLFKLEQSMVYYLSAITTNGSLIERLRTSATKIGFSNEQVEAIEDLIVDNTQCYKQAEIISTIMAGMMDARASVVNNNLSMLMKHLTILSLVFMPLNLIASIGGMSEYTMLSEAIGLHTGLSYFIFMTVMCFAGYCMYWLMAQAESED